MEPNMRDVLILLYGSILAFLFGIAGTLIGNTLDAFPVDDTSLLFIIIIIFMLIFAIFREIVRVFGIGKTKSDQIILLRDAHSASLDFYRKHKGVYIFRFKDENSLKEILILMFQLSLVLTIFISILMFFYLGIKGNLFGFVFLILLILLRIFGNKLQDKIDLKIFNFAKSQRAKIDFLLRSGELFSNFGEYHLIFDFEDNTCYFVLFDKDEELEKKIKDEIVTHLRFPRLPRAS